MTTRTITIAVGPADAAIYDERMTTVTITDEASGEFVTVEQTGDHLGKIQINPDEWPALRRAINRMVRECRPTEIGPDDM